MVFGTRSIRALFVLVACIVVAAGVRTSDAAAAAEGPAALRTYARCMRAMADATCVAASPGARSADTGGPAASVVFVAGAGPVPGAVYRELVRADARMCDMVRAACARDPQGSVCSTAARLW